MGLATSTALGMVISSLRMLIILMAREDTSVTTPCMPLTSMKSPLRRAREYTSTRPLMAWLTTPEEPRVSIRPKSTDRPLKASLLEPGR